MTRHNEMLASLRHEFVANTRGRLAEMSELLERLTAGSEQSRLADLRRHFHSLAGLGGTYGYPTVTSLSFDAEELCDKESASPATIRHLEAIIKKLISEIENDPDNE